MRVLNVQRRSLLITGSFAFFLSGCMTPNFDFGEEPDSSVKATQPEMNHCENRAQDADETDIDCGGLDCAPCRTGSICNQNEDCSNDSCLNNRCLSATCQDGVKSGNELDIDCGGDCVTCSAGSNCTADNDCTSDNCSEGSCAAAACDDNRLNGDESDLDCGGSCTPCDIGNACLKESDCVTPAADDGSQVKCREMTCALLCPLGRADCDNLAENGCEVDLKSSIAHCGACGATCQPANTFAGQCLGGNCLIDFEEGGCIGSFSDCDGDPQNGCEVDITRSAQHCGACGQTCSDNNGTATCVGSLCTIECNDNYKNCDDDARANGCESNTSINAQSCGGCGPDYICSPNNPGESTFCAAGICGSTPCPTGTGDCNGDLRCDDSLDSDNHCGSCGNECSAANGSARCQTNSGVSSCIVNACTGAYADCNQSYLDGCEVDTDQSLLRCGGCLSGDSQSGSGKNCQALRDNPSLHIGGMSCSAGTCTITACEPGGWADCDGQLDNGCEVNTSSADARCGGCSPLDAQPGLGLNCDQQFDNSTGTCIASTCQWQACTGIDFANCDGDESNGCEAELQSDDEHCGICDAPCLTNSGTTANSCSAGVCSATCAPSLGQQCDGDEYNGCENISTSSSNCGACNITCGGNGAGVNTSSCSAGTCSVTCDNGLCPDLDDAETPCTASLGTTQNCTSCGETCSRSGPFCESTGCESVNQVADQERFDSGNNLLTYTHNLRLGAGTGRAVLIGVSSFGNSGSCAPSNITYAGVTAKVAAYQENSGGGVAAFYYLSDTDLSDNSIEPGNHTVSMQHPNSYYGSFVSQTLEFGGLHASAPVGNTGSLSGSNCNSATISIAISGGVNAGSRYLGALYQQGTNNPSSPAVSPAGFTTYWSSGWQQTGYFTYSAPGSTSSATFNATSCDRYAGVAVELRSE